MAAAPNDRKYSETHEWYLVDGNTVTLGITQFAADELTDITFVDLPPVGTKVSAGKPFGEIESVKATGELNCAIDGEVIEVNGQLADQPELVNSSPYENGWMIRVRVESLDPLAGLLTATQYDQKFQGG